MCLRSFGFSLTINNGATNIFGEIDQINSKIIFPLLPGELRALNSKVVGIQITAKMQLDLLITPMMVHFCFNYHTGWVVPDIFNCIGSTSLQLNRLYFDSSTQVLQWMSKHSPALVSDTKHTY